MYLGASFRVGICASLDFHHILVYGVISHDPQGAELEPRLICPQKDEFVENKDPHVLCPSRLKLDTAWLGAEGW